MTKCGAQFALASPLQIWGRSLPIPRDLGYARDLCPC